MEPFTRGVGISRFDPLFVEIRADVSPTVHQISTYPRLIRSTDGIFWAGPFFSRTGPMFVEAGIQSSTSKPNLNFLAYMLISSVAEGC